MGVLFLFMMLRDLDLDLDFRSRLGFIKHEMLVFETSNFTYKELTGVLFLLLVLAER